MAIKAADVANCAKPFVLYKQWANLIVIEFYKQGDLEQSQGMEVSAYMDRFEPDVRTCQMNFMNFIVKPLYDLVGTYAPPCRDLFKSYLIHNYEFWLEEEKDEFGDPDDGEIEVNPISITVDDTTANLGILYKKERCDLIP